jgi:hypothetical protein
MFRLKLGQLAQVPYQVIGYGLKVPAKAGIRPGVDGGKAGLPEPATVKEPSSAVMI